MLQHALKKLSKDQSGQTLIVTALCMTVLIGFVSLGVDVGMLLRAKTNLQKVADDAAIAGAAELLKSGNWNTAALTSATQNGITSGVTVSLGTTYHPGAVKVDVTQSQQTYLAALFGVQSATVTATAAAGLVNSGAACLYALNTSPKLNQGLVINGGSGNGIIMPNCGLYVNSGLVLNSNGSGGGATITAKYIGAVSWNHQGNPNPVPLTPIVPVNDPLAGYWPTPTCSTVLSDPKLINGGQIQPGCYAGLTAGGSTSFAPGLYVIRGNVNISVSSTNNTGVTFFVDSLNQGSLTCPQCAFTGTFTAPPFGSGTSTGTAIPGTCSFSNGCNGLLLWDTEVTTNTGNQSSPVTIGTSNATTTLTGIVYLPTAALTLSGGNSSTLDAAIVAASYTLNGNITINSYALGAGGATPFSSAALVE